MITRKDMCQTIADSSFYDRLTFQYVGAGQWIDTGDYFDEPEVYWTYGDGLVFQGSTPDDHSRLMEVYEYLDTAGHVEYHLGEFLDTIKEGQTIAVHYVTVDSMDPCLDCDNPDDCDADTLAGWILTVSAY
jgi:hypothetical protein